MLNVVKNDEIKSNGWDKLIGLSSVATWFQSYACYCFYKELSFLTPFAYAVEDNGEFKEQDQWSQRTFPTMLLWVEIRLRC